VSFSSVRVRDTRAEQLKRVVGGGEGKALRREVREG